MNSIVRNCLIKSKTFVALFFWIALFYPAGPLCAQVTVRYTEGLVHGFLLLSTPEGRALADGELTQFAHGDRVTSRLVFHFKDGSVHEEEAVFLQRKTFRLVSEHLVQKGPAFKFPLEVSMNVAAGQVIVRYTDDDGKEKTTSEHMNLPADIANGMTLVLLKNLPPGGQQTKLSLLAATPKPRLVKLDITSVGEDPFVVGSSNRKATHYVVKVQIGGVTGLVAPLVGKQPPDTHVWILGGATPAFVQSEGPLFQGGPIWRIALSSPHWPSERP